MFKSKKQDEVEVAEVVVEEPVIVTEGGSPVKGILALIGLLLVSLGVALAVSKPLREKALDKLFGAEEQFDYTPPEQTEAEAPVETPVDGAGPAV